MSAPTPPRLRFAPSPTGYLHVGGARTALFNWLWARKTGGTFLLRTEDTDKARSTDESTAAIFRGLEWLGLDWDEDVVYQGANVARHKADAERLVENGSAYLDFTTVVELERLRADADARKEPFRFDRRLARWTPDEIAQKLAAGEPYTIRFRVPDGTTAWDDIVHGRISFDNKEIEDFIVLRSDGTPIYNLAVVSDDIAMRITIVMRGDDHISNTPKQILLYQALGAPLPQFAHVPMIHGTDGKKLSKRRDAAAVGDWEYKGILPTAMANFLALLGWSPGGDLEVMMPEEMLAHFSLERLHRKAAIFDTQKLEWMNGQHLSRRPLEEVLPRVTDALIRHEVATAERLAADPAWTAHLVDQLRVRARTIEEVVTQARPYLLDEIEYDDAAVAKALLKDRAASADILHATREALVNAPAWTAEALEPALRTLAESRGLTAGKIFTPLRVAVTGLAVSPGIFDVLTLIGRERSLERLARTLDMLATTT
ncbi:MAG: glutamate--tRNA ligase [Gemmatimonadaceae bacterium]|nr:glutamate--tRNA ligase [Gemmatimonadaceae bacterium]